MIGKIVVEFSLTVIIFVNKVVVSNLKFLDTTVLMHLVSLFNFEMIYEKQQNNKTKNLLFQMVLNLLEMSLQKYLRVHI